MRLAVLTSLAALAACGGRGRAPPPASAYGPQMQPGPPMYGQQQQQQQQQQQPMAAMLSSCGGTPFGTYGALAERDPANRRMCRNEPPVGALVIAAGPGGALVLRPENAPAGIACTAASSGCTVRATCDERGPNGDFVRRADWEIAFQGTHYTGAVKLLDNVDKSSLPCSSRVLVSGDRIR